MNRNRVWIAAAAVLLLLLTAAGCGSSRQAEASKTEFYLDTACTVTVYYTDDRNAAWAAVYAAFDEIERLDALLSPDTALNDEQTHLAETARYYEGISDGKFDVHLGALTRLWNISGGGSSIPSDAQIAAALQQSELDLGGIAKGYIADCVKDVLKAQHVESALINLGGNVMTVGSKPDGKPFKIGIQDPFGEEGLTMGVVSVADRGIATCGTYQRFFEIDGVRYHHIMDSETGYPADTGLAAVSVLSNRSVDGDALSTVFFLLGLKDGKAMAELMEGVEALFVTSEGDVYMTEGFAELAQLDWTSAEERQQVQAK